MILIFFLLFSCLNRSLFQLVDKGYETSIGQELIDAIDSGKSENIIGIYVKEAKEKTLGRIMRYCKEDTYFSVNHAMLLLLAFPKDKDYGNDREDSLKYLIQYMKDSSNLNYINPNQRCCNSTLASLITCNCSTKTLEYFLSNAFVDLNQDEAGYLNPLMIAISKEEPDKVKLLLNKGASLTITNNAIPVAFACWTGSVEILEIMWEHNKLQMKNNPKYKDLFNTKLPTNNCYPSMYAGAHFQNNAIQFLISIDAAHYKRRDIRCMWGKKIALSSFINLVAKSISVSSNLFGIFAANFITEMMRKSASEFLSLTPNQIIMEKAQKAFSDNKSDGAWMERLKAEESNFDLLLKGLNKMLTFNYPLEMKRELRNLIGDVQEYKKVKISNPDFTRDRNHFKQIKYRLQLIRSEYSNTQIASPDKYTNSPKGNTFLLKKSDNTSYTQAIVISWNEAEKNESYKIFELPSFNDLKILSKNVYLNGIYWTNDGQDALGNRVVFNNGVRSFLPSHFNAELILIKRHKN